MPAAKRTRSSSGTMTTTAKKSKMSNYKYPYRSYVPRPVKIRFGKQPFPKQLYNQVRYCETINVTLGITGLGSYLFSCNGLYDPNITGTGHQPLYFDNLTAIYDHYTVLKSSMKMTVVSTGNYPVIASLGQDDDTGINVPTSTTFWERTGVTTTIVQTTVNQAKPLYSYWNASSVFGGDPQAQDSLQGNSGANPTEQTYWVCYFDGGPAGISGTLTFLVEILYDTVWDEFVSVNPS